MDVFGSYACGVCVSDERGPCGHGHGIFRAGGPGHECVAGGVFLHHGESGAGAVRQESL